MEHLEYKPEGLPFLGETGEALFLEQAQLRTFKRHALLYSPGDDASHVYRVAHGEVKLARYSAEGRELTLGHLGSGELFGETEILMGVKRECEALARSDSAVYVLEKEALLSVLEAHPALSLWLTRTMVARQARMENRMETLLFKSANGKVAQVLADLAREHGKPAADGTLIDYPITHQEIGSLIATTRETVSYAFMAFREMGLISTRQRRTVVHDLQRLAMLALD